MAIPGGENWFFMSQQKEDCVKSLEIKLTSYTCFSQKTNVLELHL